MSRSRRQIGCRSSGTKVRNASRIRKQAVNQKGNRPGGRVYSTAIALGIAVALVLGLSIIVIIGHESNIANATSGGPTMAVPTGYGSLSHPKGPCGNAAQASCAPVDPGWFPVGSESPGVVSASIAASKVFVAMENRYGCASLDTPALVHAYGAHTGIDYYDDNHWVVSVHDASGMRCGLFDFVYDRAQQRMRFSSFGVLTPQDPHSSQAFPYISSAVAVARLQSQRKLNVRAGAQPELIFFPIDPSFPYLNSPVHKWAGGGNSAMNPMWHMVGSDAHDYFIGNNLNVSVRQDLPIANGQP
jgi:hypothetical protein